VSESQGEFFGSGENPKPEVGSRKKDMEAPEMPAVFVVEVEPKRT
jgi:hypothetical protein